MLFLIASYVVVGSWMEHKHFKLGHETGAIILIGMVISVSVYFWSSAKAHEYQEHPERARWIDNDPSKFTDD